MDWVMEYGMGKMVIVLFKVLVGLFGYLVVMGLGWDWVLWKVVWLEVVKVMIVVVVDSFLIDIMKWI